MKKIKKYKAAYLDKNAKPRKIPTNKDVKLEFSLNEINKNNKDKDQKNNSGVSVEIMNPPNEAAGVNIQIKAAILPALELKAICPHFHKIIEVRK